MFCTQLILFAILNVFFFSFSAVAIHEKWIFIQMRFSLAVEHQCHIRSHCEWNSENIFILLFYLFQQIFQIFIFYSFLPLQELLRPLSIETELMRFCLCVAPSRELLLYLQYFDFHFSSDAAPQLILMHICIESPNNTFSLFYQYPISSRIIEFKREKNTKKRPKK